MIHKRTAFSEDTARAIRQRSGFGCVICGEMPCDIEHIVPVSKGGTNEISNLTLLCTKHHREVTAGRISKKDVERFRGKPARLSSRYELFLRSVDAISIGGSRVEVGANTNVRILSFLSGVAFGVRIENGLPLFYYSLLDRTGAESIRMIDNIISFVSSRLWDVKLSGRYLTVRLGERSVLLRLKLVYSTIEIERMAVLRDGIAILSTRKCIAVIYSDQDSPALIQYNYFIAGNTKMINIIATEGVPYRATIRLPVQRGSCSIEGAQRFFDNFRSFVPY